MKATLYKRLLCFYGISLSLLTVLRLVFIGVHYKAGLQFGEVLKASGIGILIDSSVMSCPHLTVILTMSNHMPFDIPPHFSETHPEVSGFKDSKASYYYSEYYSSFNDTQKDKDPKK